MFLLKAYTYGHYWQLAETIFSGRSDFPLVGVGALSFEDGSHRQEIFKLGGPDKAAWRGTYD